VNRIEMTNDVFESRRNDASSLRHSSLRVAAARTCESRGRPSSPL